MAKIINKNTVGAFVVGGIVVGGATYYYLNYNKNNSHLNNTNNQLDANNISSFKDIVNDIVLKLKYYDNINIIPTDKIIYDTIKLFHKDTMVCPYQTIIDNIAYVRDQNQSMLIEVIKDAKINKTNILEDYIKIIVNRIRISCPNFLKIKR